MNLNVAGIRKEDVSLVSSPSVLISGMYQRLQASSRLWFSDVHSTYFPGPT